jgi:hypothetical protein
MALTALRFDFSEDKFINLLRTNSSDMRTCGKGVLQPVIVAPLHLGIGHDSQ